jgi:hypothetical protein
MRKLLTFLALVLLAAPLAGQSAASVCKDGSSSAATGRGACAKHGGVDAAATAKAHSGRVVGSIVSCKDGSTSPEGRGACSHHGGVLASTATVAHTPTAPAPRPTTVSTEKPTVPSAPRVTTSRAAPTGASAQCTDGTYSMSAHRRGACSHHGGVSKWLATVPP